MSSWRFQVFRSTADSGEVFYAVHEFYTMHDGKEGYTARPITFEAESVSDLRMALLNALRDLERHGVRDFETGVKVEATE